MKGVAMTWNWHGRAWPAVFPAGTQRQGEQYITKTLMAKGFMLLAGWAPVPTLHHVHWQCQAAPLPYFVIVIFNSSCA